jgi:hypothetical protein
MPNASRAERMALENDIRNLDAVDGDFEVIPKVIDSTAEVIGKPANRTIISKNLDKRDPRRAALLKNRVKEQSSLTTADTIDGDFKISPKSNKLMPNASRAERMALENDIRNIDAVDGDLISSSKSPGSWTEFKNKISERNAANALENDIRNIDAVDGDFKKATKRSPKITKKRMAAAKDAIKNTDVVDSSAEIAPKPIKTKITKEGIKAFVDRGLDKLAEVEDKLEHKVATGYFNTVEKLNDWSSQKPKMSKRMSKPTLTKATPEDVKAFDSDVFETDKMADGSYRLNTTDPKDKVQSLINKIMIGGKATLEEEQIT